MAKQDDWAKITLRLPPDLHRKLAEATGANSLNAEIVQRLDESFSEDLRGMAIEHFAIALGRALDRLGREFGIGDAVPDGFYRLANRLHQDPEVWSVDEADATKEALASFIESIVAAARGQKPEIDVENPTVPDAMIQSVRELMSTVTEDMREENRINSGIPLLLRWFDAHPDERQAYDELPDEEQDEFVRTKAQELWLDHLNRRRSKSRRKRK